MGKPEIIILSPVRADVMDQLASRFTLLRADLAGDAPHARAAFIARHGASCRALLTNGMVPLSVAMLDAMPKQEFVSCSTAGFDALPVAELAARGIALANTSPALRDDVADMGMLLMLAGARSFVAGDAYVRRGDWARQGMFPLQSSISGKRLGIVGLGSLGMAIGARAQAFKMQISYWNRSPKPVDWRYERDLLRLAKASDVLILTVAGGPETAGLISAEVIEALGPTGLLVNIARGSVIDEPALIAALERGALGAAALDVYAAEADPDPRLTALPNVQLSPHRASGTEEARRAMAQLAVDNLLAFMDGKPLISSVAI